MKNAMDIQQIRWSQWLESMRKDVECTFGILKGQWRVLKAGIRVHGVRKADNIWHTCCALHNWLLESDGLNQEWDSGELTSEWESRLGDFEDSNFVEQEYSSADAVARLHNPEQWRAYDSSTFGLNNHDKNGEFVQMQSNPGNDGFREFEIPNEEPIRVKDLQQSYFRERLIEHFNILFERGELIWPKRNSTLQPTYP
jgi:hypothetical protein